MKLIVVLAMLILATAIGTGQERLPKKEPDQPKKEQRHYPTIHELLNSSISTTTWPVTGQMKDESDWKQSQDSFESYSRGKWVRVSVTLNGNILRLRDDKGKVYSVQLGPVDPLFDPPGEQQGVFRGYKFKVTCSQKRVSFSLPPEAEEALRNLQPGATLILAVPMTRAAIDGAPGRFNISVSLQPGSDPSLIEAKLIAVQ